MKRCLITGAGEFPERNRLVPRPGDLLIAADGGYRYLTEMGLKPDLLVADFDSMPECAPDGVPLLRFRPEKNDTDTGLAISEGRRRGYERFCLFGGVGGREDHTIANLQALTALARDGLRGFLYGNGWLATAVTDGELSMRALPGGFVSVFAVDNRCEGVTLRGLKYELDHAALTNDFPLGVSNELIGKPARIRVEQGTLLVICPPDAMADDE